ncbi:MAG TPA: ATP-binding protein [Limnobacter sp.]|nr:ATP-binding protein [Limnobacter sp.]
MNPENPGFNLLEHSPVGLMQVDHQGHVLSLNTYCASIFGYTVQEMLGQKFDILLPPSLRSLHADLFNDFLATESGRMMGQGSDQRYFPAVRKDGAKIQVQIGLNIRREEGRPIVILAIADVTDKARMLKELKEGNEKLKEKTRELMQVVRQQNHFLNVVSHELRTPLSNSLETLNQLSATRLDDDQAELFKDLDKANRDVTRSVKMLMDYADSMLGELALEEEEFDLRALWLERLRLVKRAHPDLSHLVQTVESFEFDPLVLGDKTRLGRMMHGLVDNALKFSSATEIRVNIEFQTRPAPFLIFEVQDNGIGMPEALLKSVGKPFGNHEQRRSRGGGGMGVGFYLTRKYLQLMHGRFKLNSKPGEGTQAGFELPLQLLGKASAQSVAAQPDSPALPLHHMKLLLVEDDTTVARINAARLRKMGAEVTVAENGQVALDLLKEGKSEVAAILMDLHMPVMDGFSATRLIRQMEQHAKTPIVAVTAGSRLAEYARAMATGIDAFYSKPLEPNVLVHYLKARGLIR